MFSRPLGKFHLFPIPDFTWHYLLNLSCNVLKEYDDTSRGEILTFTRLGASASANIIINLLTKPLNNEGVCMPFCQFSWGWVLIYIYNNWFSTEKKHTIIIRSIAYQHHLKEQVLEFQSLKNKGKLIFLALTLYIVSELKVFQLGRFNFPALVKLVYFPHLYSLQTK